jgi:diguanylate cyclase (GGDEF)-like protein
MRRDLRPDPAVINAVANGQRNRNHRNGSGQQPFVCRIPADRIPFFKVMHVRVPPCCQPVAVSLTGIPNGRIDRRDANGAQPQGLRRIFEKFPSIWTMSRHFFCHRRIYTSKPARIRLKLQLFNSMVLPDGTKNMFDDDNTIERTVVADSQSIRSGASARALSRDALVLIYPTGDNLGRKWEITGQTVNIGRDPASDIVVAKDSVSRRHARLFMDNGQRRIEDLQSTNGTYVNDLIIDSPCALKHGDQIKIGDTIFKYLSGDENESAYHDEIYKMKITDGLTGIYNRRHLIDEMIREIHRSTRYRRVLSLIMIDIDFFKSINDTWGHIAGDLILKEVTRLISSISREEDVFARYGGEEFAILIPETPPDEVILFAERIRKTVENHRFLYEGSEIKVTISMGVATIHGERISETDFIAAADEKLYLAKHQGRNRVCY